MNNNDDIFLKNMKGVSPLKKKHIIRKANPKINAPNLKKNKTKTTEAIFTKHTKEVKNSKFNLEKIEIKKSIKKGSFKIDKKIDFHGKTLVESEEIFNNTIIDCYKNGNRCLLFVTGKGLFKQINKESNNQPKLYHGVIRSAFADWVRSNKHNKHILSFEQASLDHGGDGAFYVYLRKNKN